MTTGLGVFFGYLRCPPLEEIDQAGIPTRFTSWVVTQHDQLSFQHLHFSQPRVIAAQCTKGQRKSVVGSPANVSFNKGANLQADESI